MAGAQCREVGREGGAADFAELCIAGVSEGAARTARGRGGGGGAQGRDAERLRRRPDGRCRENRKKEGSNFF